MLRNQISTRNIDGGSGDELQMSSAPFASSAVPARSRTSVFNYLGSTYNIGGGGGGSKTQPPERPQLSRSIGNMAYMPNPLGLHGERLHKIVVFELREDGGTEYSSMTLRALYNHVVRAITEGCRQANSEGNQAHRRTMFMSSCKQATGAKTVIPPPSIYNSDDFDGDSTDTAASKRHPLISIDSARTPEIGVIPEGVEISNDNKSSPNPTNFYASPHLPTTPSNNINPPHLPSLTSSNANSTPPSSEGHRGSLPTPIMSNQSLENHSPHDNNEGHSHHTQQSSGRPQHQQRAVQTSFTPNTYSASQRSGCEWCSPLPNGSSHRERLGGYLHPRDMRRLVTPFSSSNEPQLMVRRHVMLLNFDPLRAIVLRDRLLVLVPDGADSILIELERRVRGGIEEMVDQVFGRQSVHDAVTGKVTSSSRSIDGGLQSRSNNDPGSTAHSDNNSERDSIDSLSERSTKNSDEWEHMQKMDWADMPYELQCVDAVLQTVTHMLMDDASVVHNKAKLAMSVLRGESSSSSSFHSRNNMGAVGDHAQERLRLHKDEINLMEGRVQGFVRAMNEVLDDDEDMTLMNLSRLLTHPERFLQPVSQEILHEESDEPELILEAYLQQSLSIVNELDLLKCQITTTEEQISMMLDAVRNRLLYINTLLSVASLTVSLGSFIGSIFGMNLKNPLEDSGTAFMTVTVGTVVSMVGMWVILSWVFYMAANLRSGLKKKMM